LKRLISLLTLALALAVPASATATGETRCLYLEPEPLAIQASWAVSSEQGLTGFRIFHRYRGETTWAPYVEVKPTLKLFFHYTITGLEVLPTEVLVQPRYGEVAGKAQKKTATPEV